MSEITENLNAIIAIATAISALVGIAYKWGNPILLAWKIFVYGADLPARHVWALARIEILETVSDQQVDLLQRCREACEGGSASEAE